MNIDKNPVQETIHFEVVYDEKLAGKDGKDAIYKDGKNGDIANNSMLYISNAIMLDGDSNIHKTMLPDSTYEDYLRSIVHDGQELKIRVHFMADPWDIDFPLINGKVVPDSEFYDLEYDSKNGMYSAWLNVLLDDQTKDLTITQKSKSYSVITKFENPNLIGQILNVTCQDSRKFNHQKSHYKNGDEIKLTITVEKDLISFKIPDDCDLKSTGWITIADLTTISSTEEFISFEYIALVESDKDVSGRLECDVMAKNKLGSARRFVDQTALVDNVLPTAILSGVIYDNGFKALDVGDIAKIEILDANNYSIIEYKSDLSLSFIDTSDISKLVIKCIQDGIYSVGDTNATIIFKKPSNGSELAVNVAVNVASKLPTVSITTSEPHLRTNREGLATYLLNIDSDQVLANSHFTAPNNAGFVRTSVNAEVVVNETHIEIRQSDIKGDYVFDTSNMVNLAGKPALVLNKSYKIQGFLPHRYQLGAFENEIELNEIVTNPENLVIMTTDLQAWKYQVNNESRDHAFTVSSDGKSVIILDSVIINSNASGQIPLWIEEK